METETPDTTGCLPVSAESLGFQVYRPAAVPPDSEFTAIEEAIRYKNLISLELLSETIARQALDPATSLKGRLEAQEQMRKLAGLDAKQKIDPSQLGGGVTITINMPSKGRPPITVQGDSQEVVDVDTEASA